MATVAQVREPIVIGMLYRYETGAPPMRRAKSNGERVEPEEKA